MRSRVEHGSFTRRCQLRSGVNRSRAGAEFNAKMRAETSSCAQRSRILQSSHHCMSPMKAWRFKTAVAIILSTAALSVHAQEQPRFTRISRDGSISWTSQTNVLYLLQRTAQLGPDNWTDVGAQVAGDGGTLLVRDTNQQSGQAFYRIVATNVPPCTNTSVPVCATAVSLGTVNADMDGCRAGPIAAGCGNAWFYIRAREGNGGQTIDLRLDVALDSSPGSNYDLFLQDGCVNVLRSSTLGPGMRDEVFYTFPDIDGVNNSRDFWIEVRRAINSPPGYWTLRTSGGTGPCY